MVRPTCNLLTRFAVTRYKHPTCLLLILALHISLRLWAFSGIHDLDEIFYSEAALRFRQGLYVGTSPQSVRYLLIVPLAISQALFGINEYSSVITPMIYSLACLLLIFLIAKMYADNTVALMAAGLWAIFPLDVILATELHLDLPMTTFQALSIYLLVLGERSIGTKRTVLFILSGSALGLAHLAKEVGLVLLTFIVLRSIWRGVGRAEYLLLFGGVAFIEMLEMGWFALMTGNPLYRFSGTIWNLHFVLINTGTDPPYRWLIDYMEFLLHPFSSRTAYLGGFFFPVLIGTFLVGRSQNRHLADLILWWVSILLVFNFVPLDLSFERPLFHHYPRTLHPIFLPGLIVAAYAIARTLPRIGSRFLLFVCLSLFSLGSISVVRLDNQLWAEAARRSLRYAHSLPRQVTLIIDSGMANQLSFFNGFHADNIKNFSALPLPITRQPQLWVYDRFSIEWVAINRPALASVPPYPSCPNSEIALDLVPPSLRVSISHLIDIFPGLDRVEKRWKRDPIRLFLCEEPPPPVRT